MIERQPLIFVEGPQGVGKTTAARFAETLGFRSVRGIPSGERLIANSEIRNWITSIHILDGLIKDNLPTVTDRSLWSLVVFNMRKKPYASNLIYNLGRSLLRRRVNEIDHKVVVIFSSADTCLTRANPNSPVSITDLSEANQEIKLYSGLLEKLKRDGFRARPINNFDIPEEQFLQQIKDVLTT